MAAEASGLSILAFGAGTNADGRAACVTGWAGPLCSRTLAGDCTGGGSARDLLPVSVVGWKEEDEGGGGAAAAAGEEAVRAGGGGAERASSRPGSWETEGSRVAAWIWGICRKREREWVRVGERES